MHLTDDELKKLKGSRDLQICTAEFLGNIFINIYEYVYYIPHAKICNVIHL